MNMETCIWKQIPFLFYIFITIPRLTLSQPEFLQQFCQVNSTNAAYQANLKTLLSTLAPNTDGYGFYSSSFGQFPNTAHAMALCRGDTELYTCRNCISNATVKLQEKCPESKEAFGWYEKCMVRYSNKSINGTLEINPPFFAGSLKNASNVEQFNEDMSFMLGHLGEQAASGGDRRKFATGSASGPDFTTIYGLVQCTPDLSEDDCYQCLFGATTDMISSCCHWVLYGKIGGRAYKPSCHLEFETDYAFYNNSQVFNDTPPTTDSPPPSSPSPPPLSPPPPSTSPVSGKSNNDTTSTIVIIVASVIGFMIVLALVIFLFVRKGKQKKPRRNIEAADATSGIDISDITSLQYDFYTITVATNDFSDDNKLGQGGFGAVYKGELSNGQEIAVKRLAQGSGQGELEFKNEVMLLAKLSHRNLVRLLGFCFERAERLLVYEFVPNSSLDQFIFNSIQSETLDSGRRYKIINGIAKGLLYLHEDSRLRIIHRDLKSSNVLLDDKFIPKIADFGMARLVGIDETQGITCRIVGTYGYMSPEYAMYGKFSVKSDVFSFGVLILEITSGKRNNHFRNGDKVENLISYVWKNWWDGTASNVIDPILRSNLNPTSEIMRCIHIGLLCVQENVAARPTMASVVFMLSNLSVELPLPSEPAFLFGEHVYAITSDPSLVSLNEMSITELGPR